MKTIIIIMLAAAIGGFAGHKNKMAVEKIAGNRVTQIERALK